MNRRAFTLIELTIAIGIIVVLMGMAFVALRYANNQSHANATRVALENAKSMLAEMEMATKFQTQPAVIFQYPGGAWATPGLTTPIFWANASDTSNVAVSTPAPGLVTAESGSPDRTDCAAVYNTIVAMTELARLPVNKAAMDRMPTSEILRITPLLAGGPANPAPILLDGWHNPIIFVPGAGGLVLGTPYTAGRNYVAGDYVLSGGNSYRCIQPTSIAPPNATYWQLQTTPIHAPNNRPFFVSAGPDGDFSKGDDNIYSFEQ